MLLLSIAFLYFVAAKIIVIDRLVPAEKYAKVCKKHKAEPLLASEDSIENILSELKRAKRSDIGWIASFDGTELENVGMAIGKGKEGVPILEITDIKDIQAENVSICWKPKNKKTRKSAGDKKKVEQKSDLDSERGKRHNKHRKSHSTSHEKRNHKKAESDSESTSSDESSS